MAIHKFAVVIFKCYNYGDKVSTNHDGIDTGNDCENRNKNTTTYNFNTLGKAILNQKQINRIGFILATDLKAFAETNGNLSALTTNTVYTHLQNHQ